MTRRQFAVAALSGLAILALGSLVAGAFVLGISAWIVAYLGLLWRAGYNRGRGLQRTLLGAFAPVDMLLIAATAVVLALTGAFPVMSIVVALALVPPGLDGMLRRATMYDGTRVANLPGVRLRAANHALVRAYLGVTLLAPAVLLIAVTGMTPGGPSAAAWTAVAGAVAVLQLLLMLGLLVDTYRRRAASRLAYDRLPEELAEHAPRFVFYWDAPAGTAYQVGMWVPYLQRIGEPFFIMVRNANTFDQAVSQSHGTPVILARAMKDMDRLVPEMLSTAFYSNNGAKNAHFVRYPQLVHIQLLHGDSDKASSFNPITAMFDRVYVAGQAGIDRYIDHNVDIPLEKFRIVGRPQVEDIGTFERPIREISQPTVLYAPTWRGNYSDASYASIPVAPQLFEQLLERGCRIMFRPHPYCYRDPEYRAIIAHLHELLRAHAAQTGIDHVYGATAESEMSVVDCFNACDVMISDVSSVVVDFLYSEKPFALISMGVDAGTFRAEFPLAAVAYVMSEDGHDWPGALDSLLRDDPLADDRAAMRTHYLGDFPREHYADGFVAEARREVLRDPSTPKA